MVQPGSTLSVEQTPDGLSIHLPRPGLKAAMAEFHFAYAYMGVLVLLTALFAGILPRSGAGAFHLSLFIGLLALFWLVAIGLLVEVWRRSRRMSYLDVVGGTLLITSAMPFSKQTITVEGTNIRALGVGPSGVVVDNVPVMALRLDLRKPVPVGKRRRRALKLFRERDEAELRQVAEHLRLALGIGQSTGTGWEADAASSTPPWSPPTP